MAYLISCYGTVNSPLITCALTVSFNSFLQMVLLWSHVKHPCDYSILFCSIFVRYNNSSLEYSWFSIKNCLSGEEFGLIGCYTLWNNNKVRELDISGVVHYEFVRTGQTVNQVHYLEVVKRLCEKVRRNDPNFLPTTHRSCITTLHLLTRQCLCGSS